VAAYPVSGPVDIIPGSNAGVCDDDLRAACLAALKLSRKDAIKHAQKYSWEAVSDIFISHLTPQYNPVARRRFRRIRRFGAIASSPYHAIKMGYRRTKRFASGKSVPRILKPFKRVKK